MNNQGVPSLATWVRIDAGYAGTVVRRRPARRAGSRPCACPAPCPGPVVVAKPPATIASVARAKSITLKVTRKGGKLIVSFALPKGTFNGNVRLYQVTHRGQEGGHVGEGQGRRRSPRRS